MAIYPGAENEIRTPFPLLLETVSAIFQAAGMLERNALIVADSLAQADLRGIHSHGVLRVPDYVKKLTDEGVDPRGEPSLAKDNAAALVVDCGNTLGQVGMAYATDKVIERASQLNLAFAAVGNSNHCGTMEYFARKMLGHGMIGICGTNALPTMAPIGGREKIIGINPIGIAIPGGDAGDFVLDFAFGATAHGKIRIYAQKGEDIPEGWALDPSGTPTTDAFAALDGLIQPIGAHKGVGLGMAVGMLSSFLSDAGYGTGSGNMIDGAYAGKDGHFVMAINIAAFTGIDNFRQRVDAALNEIRSSARAHGAERLFTPGEIEADFEASYSADGVPLNNETISGIQQSAEVLNADVSRFTSHIEDATGKT